MIFLRAFCCLIFVIGPGWYTALGADTTSVTTARIVAAKITGNIGLSGKLDDPNWLIAKPVELQYEVTPGDNIPPTQRTLVRTLFNDQYVYFGFECNETRPSEIRAHVTDRDKPYDDD